MREPAGGRGGHGREARSVSAAERLVEPEPKPPVGLQRAVVVERGARGGVEAGVRPLAPRVDPAEDVREVGPGGGRRALGPRAPVVVASRGAGGGGRRGHGFEPRVAPPGVAVAPWRGSGGAAAAGIH